jgi:hypothetical protein
MACVLSNMGIVRSEFQSGEDLDTYSEGLYLEFQLGHRMIWLRPLVVFLKHGSICQNSISVSSAALFEMISHFSFHNLLQLDFMSSRYWHCFRPLQHCDRGFESHCGMDVCVCSVCVFSVSTVSSETASRPNERLMRTYHWISLFMSYIKSAN